MANQRLDPVSYRPLRVNPVLNEGLLAIGREGGDLERRVAQGMARFADQQAGIAEQDIIANAKKWAALDAHAGAPQPAMVTPGTRIETAASGSAGAGAGVSASPDAAAAKSFLQGRTNKGADAINGMKDGFAGKLSQLFQAAPAEIRDGLGVYSGFRSVERQTELWNEALAKYGSPDAARRWVAPPGRSQHNHGNAADLSYNGQSLKNAPANVVSWLHENAGKFGLSFPLGNENWHIEDAGARGDHGSPISPASVAPPKVTVTETPATVTPGKAGTWRPTGGNTLWDRVYKAEGTRTYLEELDATMRQDQAAVYDAYKDNPEQLQKAYDQLLTAHMRESVFDEVAPDYERAFKGNAFAMVRRAQAEKEQRDKAQNRVDFLDRVGGYEDQKSRLLAGLNPDDPAAQGQLADMQGAIDAHYDSAVARGVLSANEAALAKRQSRADTTIGFYLGQAKGKSADEITAMHAEMQRDYAAGGLEGVTAEDWDKIEAGLTSAARTRKAQDDQAGRALKLRGDAMVKAVAAGVPVPPDQLVRFQLDAGTAPGGAAIVGETLAKLNVSDAIRKLPINEVEKRLPDLVKLPDGSTSAAALVAGRKAIADQRKALATDPLGVAERFGVIPPMEALPIGQDVASVESAIGMRMASADVAAQHFGVSPRYFRPEEVQQIKGLIATNPDAALSMAAGIVSGAGDKAPAVLAEFGDKAPGLKQAGGVLVLGGDADAARDLLAGYGKAEDGKAYKDLPPGLRMPENEKAIGTALVFDQGLARSFSEGAAAIARKRVHDAGLDPKSPEAGEIYSRALNEAAGGRYVDGVQYGGFATFDPGFRWKARQVVVPPSMRADRFEDVVAALTDADLGGVTGKNGKAWRASDFQNAMPVRVNGGYAFAQGDPSSSQPLFITDDKGAPIVLDFENKLAPALRARVPGAYR